MAWTPTERLVGAFVMDPDNPTRIDVLKRKLEQGKKYPPIPTDLTRPEADFLEGMATGKFVLEIGGGRGFSTIFLARSAKHVYMVDWHLGTPSPESGDLALSPMSGSLGQLYMHLELNNVLAKVTSLVGQTDQVLPLLRDQLFGLVVVDGSPLAHHRLVDLIQAWRLVTPYGTILARAKGQGVLGLQEFFRAVPARHVDGKGSWVVIPRA
jgi:hypothetical protein